MESAKVRQTFRFRRDGVTLIVLVPAMLQTYRCSPEEMHASTQMVSGSADYSDDDGGNGYRRHSIVSFLADVCWRPRCAACIVRRADRPGDARQSYRSHHLYPGGASGSADEWRAHHL